jgi:hypothetical protein
VTSLPTWAVWLVALGSPVATAVIAIVAQYLNRRAARELETRSRREEVMRNLRWAAELAVSEDVRTARLGIEQLQALRDSQILSPAEEGFIDAALRAAIAAPRQAIEQARSEVEVIATTEVSDTGEALVPSEEDKQEEPDT